MFKRAIKKIKHLIKPIIVQNVINNSKIENLLENTMLQNGKIWTELLHKKNNVNSLSDLEFKVFSQWGDDGIIQYLVNVLNIENKVFIEFGVEDYLESNTRFLLFNNNWSGLIMDGCEEHISKIKKSSYYWKYDLIAKSAFITAENINNLIEKEKINGEIGLLHIDIDGNDYWVWKALTVVNPIIVIVEYNSIFGKDRAVTIPYKPDFVRTISHKSNLYAGTSLMSLCDLAEQKDYAFIGCNSAGNNAYFVKKKALKNIKELTLDEGFVESKFRESRNIEGKLNYLRGKERIKNLKGLPVYNTRLNKIENL